MECLSQMQNRYFSPFILCTFPVWKLLWFSSHCYRGIHLFVYVSTSLGIWHQNVSKIFVWRSALIVKLNVYKVFTFNCISTQSSREIEIEEPWKWFPSMLLSRLALSWKGAVQKSITLNKRCLGNSLQAEIILKLPCRWHATNWIGWIMCLEDTTICSQWFHIIWVYDKPFIS